jgi:uncharacterized protein YutE (UPF0331/DUF86 family)
MTKPELVAHKVSRVTARLVRVRSGLEMGAEKFSSSVGAVEQVAFNMFLAIQESADVASHIVTDEGWGTPATLAELFDLLQQHGVVTADTAIAMARGTRLRNLIAHAYGDLDPAKLFEAASAGVGQIERFLDEVGAWVAARTAGA